MSIKVENLTHIYDKKLPVPSVALDDVSFNIEAGEFIGIIGHTGSGKSTLLQHLNGLLKPESGKIYIDGEDITLPNMKMLDIRRKVGLVFQYPEYQLFEETVATDVAFGPKNLGLSQQEIDSRVRAALELVGFDYDKVKDKSPFELSGGQKRRVAIAGVISMHPKVLILDEPTAGLDPKMRKSILDMICDIHDSMNITVILVSHNMDDIARLADRVFVMSNGKLVMEGTPKGIFSDKETLESVNLDVPPITEFTDKLRSKGFDLPEDIIDIDTAVREIATVLENKKG